MSKSMNRWPVIAMAFCVAALAWGEFPDLSFRQQIARGVIIAANMVLGYWIWKPEAEDAVDPLEN